MNRYGELLEALGRLKRNETQMSDEQKERYKGQLSRLKERIQSFALDLGRSYLFSGIRIVKGDKDAMVRIRSVLSENEIGDAERDALAVLFSCYDFDRYLESLTPLMLKIFYLGYGPYWTSHCKKVSDGDGEAEFTYYNDIIDMYWVPEWHEWKTKGRWEVTIMLPPTMEAIREEYAREIAQLGGEDEED